MGLELMGMGRDGFRSDGYGWGSGSMSVPVQFSNQYISEFAVFNVTYTVQLQFKSSPHSKHYTNRLHDTNRLHGIHPISSAA